MQRRRSSIRTCAIPDCMQNIFKNGYCKDHSNEFTQTGDDKSSFLSQIEKGTELKSVEIADKSAPVIEKVEIKKVDRTAHLAAVQAEHKLKHVETVDKSGPAIESDVKVKASVRPALLAEIKSRPSQ